MLMPSHKHANLTLGILVFRRARGCRRAARRSARTSCRRAGGSGRDACAGPESLPSVDSAASTSAPSRCVEEFSAAFTAATNFSCTFVPESFFHAKGAGARHPSRRQRQAVAFPPRRELSGSHLSIFLYHEQPALSRSGYDQPVRTQSKETPSIGPFPLHGDLANPNSA